MSRKSRHIKDVSSSKDARFVGHMFSLSEHYSGFRNILPRINTSAVSLCRDTLFGLRYSIAHAQHARISAEFQEPDGLLHLPAPICLLRPALRCYSLTGGPTLAPRRTWRQLVVLVACLLARSVSTPIHRHQGASLPRLRLARPRISGHRPHLQAEAPVARRHAGLPAASPPAPHQSGSALPRTTGSNRGHIFISLSSLHPTLRYL